MTRLSWIVFIIMIPVAITIAIEIGGVGAWIGAIFVCFAWFELVRRFTLFCTGKEPGEKKEKDKQNITIVFNFKQED